MTEVEATILTSFILKILRPDLSRITQKLSKDEKYKNLVTSYVSYFNTTNRDKRRTLSSLLVEHYHVIVYACTQNSKSNNEDDIELINKIKVIGANCIPPILTWPTYDSIQPGAKIIKTSATNLHQYLPPNMPPDNEMKTILETLEWSNAISFPLKKKMKYTKNKKITRKDYNDEKQLKREKRNYDEIKV